MTAHGVRVWYDKFDLNVGESIPGKINLALSEAKYFLIVLSQNAMASSWVHEELNAALMRQVSSQGTFIIPVMIEACATPPLLAHRQSVDFRVDYDNGLEQLLEVFRRDAEVLTKDLEGRPLYPWPDTTVSDSQCIYLYSQRFDKVFRMSCNFAWRSVQTVEYIVNTLKLPWKREIDELGMSLRFSYKLIHNGKALPLDKSLMSAGVSDGDTVHLGIHAVYKDMIESELKTLWDPDKLYEASGMLDRERELREKKQRRGALTRERIRGIVNSCFTHV